MVTHVGENRKTIKENLAQKAGSLKACTDQSIADTAGGSCTEAYIVNIPKCGWNRWGLYRAMEVRSFCLFSQLAFINFLTTRNELRAHIPVCGVQ